MGVTVVKVIKKDSAKNKIFIGTAFFVNQTTLITAKHVIEYAEDDAIYITDVPNGGDIPITKESIITCSKRDVVIFRTKKKFNIDEVKISLDLLEVGMDVNIKGYVKLSEGATETKHYVSASSNAQYTYELQSHLIEGLSGSPVFVNNEIVGITQAINTISNSTYIIPISECYEELKKDNVTIKVPNPFVGLKAFTRQEKKFFFGRDKEIEEISEKLYKDGFVIVVGDSGSGKSSIIKAGVIPKLENDSAILEIRPANSVYNELFSALEEIVNKEDNDSMILTLEKFSKGHETLLFYIDQFEELFTGHSQKHKEKFLNMLLYVHYNQTSKVKIKIVLTMRSDYYSSLQSYKNFYEFSNKHKYPLALMSEDALKEVISQPLIKSYLTNEEEAKDFAESVVDGMLGTKANELTLLQIALTQTWKFKNANNSLLDAYVEAKEVSGALAKLAEDTILAIDKEEELKPIFIRLIHYSSIGNHTRRVVEKDEFTDTQWKLIQKLASLLDDNGNLATREDEKLGRLLKLNHKEETVELIHEALITGWESYIDWINSIGASKSIHDGIIEKTKRYKEGKASLLRDIELNEALNLLDGQYSVFFSENEVQYLLESKSHRKWLQIKKNVLFTLLIGLIGAITIVMYLIQESEEKALLTLESSVNGAILVLNDGKNVVSLFDKPINIYGESKDLRYSKIVAKALFGKAIYYQKKHDIQKAFNYYNAFLVKVKTYNDDKEILELIALSLYNKGHILGKYDDLINRFKNSSNENIIKIVCMGWLNKVDSIKNKKEAEKELFELIKKYEKFTSIAIKEKIALAYGRLAWLRFVEKDYVKSIEFAKSSEKYLANMPYIEVNLAHAYLALDNKEESFKRYLKYKNNKKFKGAILKELQEFKVNGLNFIFLEDAIKIFEGG